MRGHVAVPLLLDEEAIGALVVNTRSPRPFQEFETRMLELLANTAALAVLNETRCDDATQRELLSRELQVARQIQSALLPHRALDVPGWSIASLYEAAFDVGGDFFDLVPLRHADERLAIVIGDVSGKSVSGALLMVATLAAFRETLRHTSDPAEVLETVNQRLRRHIQRDRFVTAFCGILDPCTGHLVYASAGHCRPLAARGTAALVEELPAKGTALGILESPGVRRFETNLASGDSLFIYSDGVTEALNGQYEMFGEERLCTALEQAHRRGAHAAVDAVLARVRAFRRGAFASDDVTMVAVHRQ